MTTALDLATKLGDEIEQFPLGQCSPSDDPDLQYAYSTGFRDIARRFVGAVKRIGDPDLADLVPSLDLDVAPYIAHAHDFRSELYVVIDALREASKDPNYGDVVASNSAFLNADLLVSLKTVPKDKFDVSKLVKMCEELNDAYARGNYITAVLLLRAVMNHVPPIFDVKSFKEVVAQSGRSLKSVLGRLEDEARPIADLHTHMTIRKSEHVPTKNQIEPYKAAFELLIAEVVGKLEVDENA
ncbi:hypothetical protein A8U91_00290 [Halomonas elongata]|uniref:Uncharacterized protein n=1 Tax=Halomonas elongata TaxID=2746 RepID=A0A1B8P120_HALEL|nr:hypothetical protein [Halomonas elongata]OBX35954.1 hypothetical protein A8U91_00290 [Halomonas elongata]